MADNVPYTPGVGVTIAADDISGTHYQRVKIVLGTDGTSLGDVDVTNRFPIAGTVSVSGPAQVSGTVSVSGAAQVSGTVSVSAMPAMSISVSAVLGTIITQLGTQMVSVVPGVSVVAQVSGTVSLAAPLSTVVYTTAQASGSTGMLVYLAASQTVNMTVSVTTTVTITATDTARTAIMLMVSSTVVPAGTTVLFTVYQGNAQTVAAVTGWTVPAGKTFRITTVQLDMSNSITTTPASMEMVVIVSGATPTWTSAVPRMAQLKLRAPNVTSPRSDRNNGLSQDVAAGQTVAIACSAATATATIVQGNVMGYLFP